MLSFYHAFTCASNTKDKILVKIEYFVGKSPPHNNRNSHNFCAWCEYNSKWYWFAPELCWVHWDKFFFPCFQCDIELGECFINQKSFEHCSNSIIFPQWKVFKVQNNMDGFNFKKIKSRSFPENWKKRFFFWSCVPTLVRDTRIQITLEKYKAINLYDIAFVISSRCCKYTFSWRVGCRFSWAHSILHCSHG